MIFFLIKICICSIFVRCVQGRGLQVELFTLTYPYSHMLFPKKMKFKPNIEVAINDKIE